MQAVFLIVGNLAGFNVHIHKIIPYLNNISTVLKYEYSRNAKSKVPTTLAYRMAFSFVCMWYKRKTIHSSP